MTGVLEVLEEIDVGGIRVAIRNATQVFANIDALLTAQTNTTGKKGKKSIVIFFKKYSLVIFPLLLIFLDISSVLTESQDRMQNFIGGVQNTINNVSKKDLHSLLSKCFGIWNTDHSYPRFQSSTTAITTCYSYCKQQ